MTLLNHPPAIGVAGMATQVRASKAAILVQNETYQRHLQELRKRTRHCMLSLQLLSHGSTSMFLRYSGILNRFRLTMISQLLFCSYERTAASTSVLNMARFLQPIAPFGNMCPGAR
mmetsp:Transcript_1728/g.4326  ORF Transcript_1728/g.4326 Transcript_1728/m.4326 type:complete len:116 (-) Transcript_1728:234-581(-)